MFSPRSGMQRMVCAALFIIVAAWFFSTSDIGASLLGLSNSPSTLTAQAQITTSPIVPPSPTPKPTAAASFKTTWRGSTQVLDVQRIGQVDLPDQDLWHSQYDPDYPYDTWAYSTCSTAAMAEVMNFYGRHYRIADVLRIQAAFKNPTVITSTDGLLYPGGIDRTVNYFGFRAKWLAVPAHLDQMDATAMRQALQGELANVLQETRSGHPVIVNFPPWLIPGGHFLTVVGGDKTSVYLVDSSMRNNGLGWQQLTIDDFFNYWRGLAVVVTLR